jgi:hypothetical protein
MVSQDRKTEGVGSFCFEQNRLPSRSVLPWRSPSTAKDIAQASKPLSPVELHALYAGTAVPQHRYLAPALVAAVHSPEIALDPAKWIAGLEEIQLPSLVDAWLHTNNNSSFEQLKCVGLDQHTGQLLAVVKITQSRGYLGGADTAGSREYVAFWVDWGFGLQYEGTASAQVFDSDGLMASEQEITVTLSADLSRHAQAECLAAPAIKVRAVLSWNTPPSTTHPYAQVVWGNKLDCRIATVSHPAAYSGKPMTIPIGLRSGGSVFSFQTKDEADRGLSFTRCRMNSAGWVRNAPSY